MLNFQKEKKKKKVAFGNSASSPSLSRPILKRSSVPSKYLGCNAHYSISKCRRSPGHRRSLAKDSADTPSRSPHLPIRQERRQIEEDAAKY